MMHQTHTEPRRGANDKPRLAAGKNRTNDNQSRRTITVMCLTCGREVVSHGRCHKRKYCTTACRARAWRQGRKGKH